MFAICSKDVEKVVMLNDHGGSRNKVDSAGNSPIRSVILSKNIDLLKYLLQYGLNPNLCYNEDSHSTLLHLSARMGSIRHVRLLIEYNASYQIQNTDGEKEKRRIESNVLSAAIVADPNVVNFLKDRYSSENGNANIHNDSINNESAHVAKSHYQFSSSRNISDKHLINASKDVEGQQDNSDIIHTGTMFSWFNQAINNNSDETQLAKRGDVT
ncbi:hypothetical protein GJ496_006649 [Pomphorhynchus laevis]|nr:hypothetical protein GJ496_006649 [Pomphorhynchus laevis]